MTWSLWLAFVAASSILLIIPGPTVLLVVSYALGQGWRTALPMAIGVALGDFTAMTLSMLGLGALLAASATLFTILKWVGAAYLVWLGVKLWRAGGTLEAKPRTDATSAAKMLGHAWLVTDGAQPQEHHLLRRLPAEEHRLDRQVLRAIVAAPAVISSPPPVRLMILSARGLATSRRARLAISA